MSDYRRIWVEAIQANQRMVIERFEGAAQFERLLAKHPNDGMLFLERGEAFEHLRLLDEAEADYTQAEACLTSPIGRKWRGWPSVEFVRHGPSARALGTCPLAISNGMPSTAYTDSRGCRMTFEDEPSRLLLASQPNRTRQLWIYVGASKWSSANLSTGSVRAGPARTCANESRT